MLLAMQFSYAQDRVVTGRVTDSKDGAGVPNVSVTVKGTRVGVQTSSEGYYRITVASGATALVFTSVGFNPQEADITGKSSADVQMVSANNTLGEVVVVGYGTSRRSDLTGSVTKVTAKDFNKGVNQTVDQLLQGRVAGLVVSRVGGDPNATSNIQLRGPGTLIGNTQPLYVVDGVPGVDINLIAPDDIASVDVLKDASATAIYGTRAANGVIMVSTKKARAGTMSVSYTGTAAVESISRKLELADASEIRSAWSRFGFTAGQTSINEDNANTDWQDVITRNGFAQNHNLSFTGGSANAKYIASVNYLEQTGIILTSRTDRLTARLSTEFTGLDNHLRLGITLNNAIINNRYVDYGTEFNSPYFQAIRYMPTMNVYDNTGKYRNVPGRYNYFNPLQMIEQYSNKRAANTFQGNVRLGLDLFKGLTYDLLMTYQKDNAKGNQFVADGAPQLQRQDWQARQYFNDYTAKILENYFTYSHKFNNLSTKFLAGYSWEQRENGTAAFKAPNALNPGILNNNLGSSFFVSPGYNPFDGGSKSTRKLVSFYGRGELNYQGKYLVNFTLRRDGSTVFGKNNKWAFFPSAAFAWRISEEAFMKNSSVFNDLKLRIGYGTSGEQGVPPFGSLLSYSANPSELFYYNGNFVATLPPARNENPDVKWQTTSMLNIGLDFAILNNKITGTLEVYNKDSKDLLFDYPVNVPPYPYPSILANEGRVKNQGIELTLAATPVKRQDFTWNTNVNFAYNKNEIVTISSGKYAAKDAIRYLGGVPGQGLSNENIFLLQPGISLGTFFLYQYEGHDRFGNNYFTGADKTSKLSNQIAARIDQNSNLGSALPKVTMGWGNTLNYKNFDLGFNVRGAFGQKIMNGIAMNLDRPFAIIEYNVTKKALDYFSNDQPRPSTKYLEDGSFVRIDNATIGYTLPKFNKYVRSARLFITVQNVATFTRYSGIDPELNLGGLTPGLDMGIYPRTRTVSFGANINL